MPKGGEQWSARRRHAMVTLLDAEVLNDTQTSVNSDAVAVDLWGNFLLFLSVDSAGSPTTVRFLLQFSDDGGTTWYTYRQGLWAALYYGAADTAYGVWECFSEECHGRDMRLRATGTGTSAQATFTVSATLELWR